MTAPSACRWCGIPERSHAQQWSSAPAEIVNLREDRSLPELPGFRIRATGEIFGPSGKLLATRPNTQGYLTFSGPRRRPSNQTAYRVHQVVCRAFHGEKPFPSAVVRHLDGNGTNNAASNLCWGTPKENAEDRALHGRTCYGEDNAATKLTDQQVAEIRERYSEGSLTQKQIAGAFGVSRSLVGQIVRNEIRQGPPVGWHKWEPPTQAQIKARMLARRAARPAVSPTT